MWIRLLDEEAAKRAELEQIHLRQQRAISETEAEKQELEKERQVKESALQAAMKQLEELEKERQGALQQYQVSPPAERNHVTDNNAITPLNYSVFCLMLYIFCPNDYTVKIQIKIIIYLDNFVHIYY